MEERRIVIFDIDGTLADCEERSRLAAKEKCFDWGVFMDRELILKDKPFEQICLMANLLHFDDFDIYLVSGREETCRDITESWLEKNRVKYKKLHMRKEKDYRPDTIVKKEIYDEHFKDKNVFCVFDDRNSVVNMWRSLGLVCLQVAEGNF